MSKVADIYDFCDDDDDMQFKMPAGRSILGKRPPTMPCPLPSSCLSTVSSMGKRARKTDNVSITVANKVKKLCSSDLNPNKLDQLTVNRSAGINQIPSSTSCLANLLFSSNSMAFSKQNSPCETTCAPASASCSRVSSLPTAVAATQQSAYSARAVPSFAVRANNVVTAVSKSMKPEQTMIDPRFESAAFGRQLTSLPADQSDYRTVHGVPKTSDSVWSYAAYDQSCTSESQLISAMLRKSAEVSEAESRSAGGKYKIPVRDLLSSYTEGIGVPLSVNRHADNASSAYDVSLNSRSISQLSSGYHNMTFSAFSTSENNFNPLVSTLPSSQMHYRTVTKPSKSESWTTAGHVLSSADWQYSLACSPAYSVCSGAIGPMSSSPSPAMYHHSTVAYHAPSPQLLQTTAAPLPPSCTPVGVAGAHVPSAVEFTAENSPYDLSGKDMRMSSLASASGCTRSSTPMQCVSGYQGLTVDRVPQAASYLLQPGGTVSYGSMHRAPMEIPSSLFTQTTMSPYLSTQEGKYLYAGHGTSSPDSRMVVAPEISYPTPAHTPLPSPGNIRYDQESFGYNRSVQLPGVHHSNGMSFDRYNAGIAVSPSLRQNCGSNSVGDPAHSMTSTSLGEQYNFHSRNDVRNAHNDRGLYYALPSHPVNYSSFCSSSNNAESRHSTDKMMPQPYIEELAKVSHFQTEQCGTGMQLPVRCYSTPVSLSGRDGHSSDYMPKGSKPQTFDPDGRSKRIGIDGSCQNHESECFDAAATFRKYKLSNKAALNSYLDQCKTGDESKQAIKQASKLDVDMKYTGKESPLLETVFYKQALNQAMPATEQNWQSTADACHIKEEVMDEIEEEPVAAASDELVDRLACNLLEEVPQCHCLVGQCRAVHTGSDSYDENTEGPYYTHLGVGPTVDAIRHMMEQRLDIKGSALRIEKVLFTGKEGKSSQGCPIAKWIIRRSGPEEKALVLTRARRGHHCDHAVMVIAICLWDGVPQDYATELYDYLRHLLPKNGEPTERRCGWNEQKTCACQGWNTDTGGASFSFGCSWSMYFNACKFARSDQPRKFRLKDKSEEARLEHYLQTLATRVAPIYQKTAPDSFRNQVQFESLGSSCRLGYSSGRPWSGITAVVDFCTHSHKDLNNMNNGCTTVLTLTKHRGLSRPEDEQLHVLPLCAPDTTDEFGSQQGQLNKMRSGTLECLTSFPAPLRKHSMPVLCKTKRIKLAALERAARGLGAGRGRGGRPKMSQSEATLALKKAIETINNRAACGRGGRGARRGIGRGEMQFQRHVITNADGTRVRQLANGHWVPVKTRGTRGRGRGKAALRNNLTGHDGNLPHMSYPQDYESALQHQMIYNQSPAEDRSLNQKSLTGLRPWHAANQPKSTGFLKDNPAAMRLPSVSNLLPNYSSQPESGFSSQHCGASPSNGHIVSGNASTDLAADGNLLFMSAGGLFGQSRPNSAQPTGLHGTDAGRCYSNVAPVSETLAQQSELFRQLQTVYSRLGLTLPSGHDTADVASNSRFVQSEYSAQGFPAGSVTYQPSSNSLTSCGQPVTPNAVTASTEHPVETALRLGQVSPSVNCNFVNSRNVAAASNLQYSIHSDQLDDWRCNGAGPSRETQRCDFRSPLEILSDAATAQARLEQHRGANGLLPGRDQHYNDRECDPLTDVSQSGQSISAETILPSSLPEIDSVTDNAEVFRDNTIGGVAIALTHGSILFEVAKRELHATTALRNPSRAEPTRISLVFYQHRNLNFTNHGRRRHLERKQTDVGMVRDTRTAPPDLTDPGVQRENTMEPLGPAPAQVPMFYGASSRSSLNHGHGAAAWLPPNGTRWNRNHFAPENTAPDIWHTVPRVARYETCETEECDVPLVDGEISASGNITSAPAMHIKLESRQ